MYLEGRLCITYCLSNNLVKKAKGHRDLVKRAGIKVQLNEVELLLNF